MSVALMTHRGQQWLRLGKRECTILDAMLEWAKITAKTYPERIQIHDDGEKYICSGGEHPRSFHVSRFDGGVPGIGWGSYGYWAVKAGQDSDWHLLFDDDRGTTVLEEVRWGTNELHGINVAAGWRGAWQVKILHQSIHGRTHSGSSNGEGQREVLADGRWTRRRLCGLGILPRVPIAFYRRCPGVQRTGLDRAQRC